MEHTPARSPSTGEDRKATLFCPECGHASPLDGDWDVRTVGGHRRVRCPECRTVVDERRGTDRRPVRAGALDRCVDAWERYWSAWTALFTGGAAESDC
ncbi:hypothetical protein [Haloplanus halophilus]|uniref:hypothetical protein n=1 Tax=Haloplanus halophilus TaxID=2949993 RepID=UPI00203C099E|nr:hypothetical protein [Haloplanus sp. GDY1]